MKKFTLLTILVLFLSSCAPVFSFGEWKFSGGRGMDKANFSHAEYAEHNYACSVVSQRMHEQGAHAPAQTQGYINCMAANGYSLKPLPPETLKRRSTTLANYMKLRTPTDSNYFDKSNFQDQVFVNNVSECSAEAQQLKKQNAPNYQDNLSGAFISGLAEGYGNSKRQRNRFLSCMFLKDYILAELPPIERSRRIQLIRNATNK